MIISIDAPPSVSNRPFCAAVVLKGSIVVKTAPILRYMLGWSVDRVYRYAQSKGWEAVAIKLEKDDAQGS